MTENPRPPVAVRIVRPYASEDELLEYELETIGKTSVILIGAHSRPTGVILRFELVLASGAPALRGEGRVLGHKDQAFRGQPGLALRFTRLDPKSKALVDRATAMREARAMGGSAQIPVVEAEVPPAQRHNATNPGFPAPPADAPREPMPTTPEVPEARAASQRPPAVRPSQRPPSVRPGSASQSPPGVRPGSQPPPGVRHSGRPSARPDPAIAQALTEDTPPPPRTSSRPARGGSMPPRTASVPPRAASQRPPPVEVASQRPPPVEAAASQRPPPVVEVAPRATATSEPDLAPALAAALRGTPVPPAPTDVPLPETSLADEPDLPPELVPTPYAGVVSVPPRRSAPPPADITRAAASPDPAREAVLSRLRDRARSLSPERVAEILASRRSRS